MGPARGALLAAAALIATALAGCSDTTETPASLSSRASELVASATAQLSDIRGAINAKDDVKAGPTRNEDGRAVCEITATNGSGRTADYTVQVSFEDADGNLLDAVVVTVKDVPAGASKTADARSNRDLSGTPRAEIGQAVRH
ncbi:FxLYD domain-containing protein [Streptomyces formicae]|uniref:DUF4333 domain-containing protein n=1 Tax=Streptomyces formicae TaxID=1616117 RepID=A0ABY3WCB8_9ACTN|nr:FxLYD domain-containing protein [Streptomyces formicae]UNM10213.1 hypothetical protein J4032_00625 [Streptomyces formicae]